MNVRLTITVLTFALMWNMHFFYYESLNISGFLVRNLNRILMNRTFEHILVECFTLIVPN
jgi:hypothetical protein